MVAEPIVVADPEIKTPTEGDAGQVAPADAAEAKTPPVETSAVPVTAEDYVKGVLAESKESEGPAPEPRRTGVDPNVEAEARRLHNVGYQARQQAVDAYEADLKEEVSEPLRKRIVKELKDRLNEEHADGLRYGGSTARALALQEEREDITAGLISSLPASVKPKWDARFKEVTEKNGGVMPYSEVFKTVYDLASVEGHTKGYASGLTKGWTDGVKHAERIAASTQSGEVVQGEAEVGLNKPYAQLTTEQRADMTYEQRDAHIARHG